MEAVENRIHVAEKRNNMVKPKNSYGNFLKKDFFRNKYIYLMMLPVMAYFIIFCYLPMYGVVIAFKDFTPGKGILNSDWVGFAHFIEFFQTFHFWRLLRNTLLINGYLIIFGFPAPIILALLLNELKSKTFKSSVQTISYLPHFVSIVVIAGMIADFTASKGIFNDIISLFGGERVPLLTKPGLFRGIYVISDIWQGIGWGSIIYLASLTSISSELYDAATVDGANRWKQLWNVTIPGIMPTITIMFILRMGSVMSLGFEKIILLYNPMTYETGDVISSYIYRRGLQEFNYSFSSAVGLFNSAVNLIFLLSANWLSRKHNETSLW
jgi:putative aldouronate transport system permease protein